MTGDVLDEIPFFSYNPAPRIFRREKNDQRLHLIHSPLRRMQPRLIAVSSPLRRKRDQKHPTLPLPMGGRTYTQTPSAFQRAPPGRGNDEPLRGSLIDSAESMSNGSGSGSAALTR